MWTLFVQGVSWLVVIFFGGQLLIFMGFVLLRVWEDVIKPRLIPRKDIERVAEEIIANYPDPEREAFDKHVQAWYDSDSARLVYWHRVRKAVGRRLKERQIR